MIASAVSCINVKCPVGCEKQLLHAVKYPAQIFINFHLFQMFLKKQTKTNLGNYHYSRSKITEQNRTIQSLGRFSLLIMLVVTIPIMK